MRKLSEIDKKVQSISNFKVGARDKITVFTGGNV